MEESWGTDEFAAWQVAVGMTNADVNTQLFEARAKHQTDAYEINRLSRSLRIADEEVHRLMDVITEQAAEIRGLQEEASDYRNEINVLRDELKRVNAFMSMGEGI